MIAREVSPGDRVIVGTKSFVVVKLPEYVDDDHLILTLGNPTTRQQGTFGCHWRHELQMVHDTSDHPSNGPE